MTAKLDPFAAAPKLMKNWVGLSLAVEKDLEPGLAHLVQIRASQINGCAHCLNMHMKDGRRARALEGVHRQTDAGRVEGEKIGEGHGRELPVLGRRE